MECKANPTFHHPSPGWLSLIGTRRYPVADIGWPDHVPTIALEVLWHCALATTYLLQG